MSDDDSYDTISLSHWQQTSVGFLPYGTLGFFFLFLLLLLFEVTRRATLGPPTPVSAKWECSARWRVRVELEVKLGRGGGSKMAGCGGGGGAGGGGFRVQL